MDQATNNWFNKNKYLILGIVFLTVVIAAAVSVIYYLQVKNIYIDTTPIVHRDPTKDWKTYTNTGYGFEFKYPKEWVLKDNTNPDDCTSSDCIKQNPSYDIKVSFINEMIFSSTYCSANPSDIPRCEGGIDWGINGDEAFVMKGKTGGQGIIELWLPNVTEDRKGVFRQVISTLKFIESDIVYCGGIGIPWVKCPTTGYICELEGSYPDAKTICKKQVETSTWKTYTNKQFGFEFKYPAGDFKKEGDDTFTGLLNLRYKIDQTIDFTIVLYTVKNDNIGVSYCQSIKDFNRCQFFKSNFDIPIVIDWGDNSTAYSTIDLSTALGLPMNAMFNLNPVSDESKEIFVQILSTFKFVK